MFKKLQKNRPWLIAGSIATQDAPALNHKSSLKFGREAQFYIATNNGLFAIVRSLQQSLNCPNSS